MQYLDIAATST